MITPIIVPMSVAVAQQTVPMSVAATDMGINVSLGAQYRPATTKESFPPGGITGDLLAKRTDADYDVEWITPANSPEQDNTRPITAAAVYTEIGNINALLATI